MSMFNYERDLHCDCYTFKDKAGDIGEIVAWDDGDIYIYKNKKKVAFIPRTSERVSR